MHEHTLSTEELKTLLKIAEESSLPPEVAERVRWFLHYKRHGSVSSTCEQYTIARSTFYRWLKRFELHNLTTLIDQPTVQICEKPEERKTQPDLPPQIHHRKEKHRREAHPMLPYFVGLVIGNTVLVTGLLIGLWASSQPPEAFHASAVNERAADIQVTECEISDHNTLVCSLALPSE